MAELWRLMVLCVGAAAVITLNLDGKRKQCESHAEPRPRMLSNSCYIEAYLAWKIQCTFPLKNLFHVLWSGLALNVDTQVLRQNIASNTSVAL